MTTASRVTAALGLILLAAAAVASWSMSRVPWLQETCADPQGLFDLGELGLETTNINDRGGRLRRSVDGFIVPEADKNNPLSFTIRRTFQLPLWAIRPTTAVPGPKEPDRFETRTVDIDGTPVDLEFSYAMHRHSLRFAAYVFIYDGQQAPGAFWVRLLESPVAPFVGVKPITYIGTAGATSLRELPEHEARATEFLIAAWRHHQRACGS